MNTTKNNNKKAVVVLGFHRGGTSAMAGILAKAGITPPKTLIEPVSGENEKGFWESLYLSKLNDDLLHAGGRAWNDLTLDGFSTERATHVTDSQIQQLKGALLDEFPNDEGTILIKDPRMCRLVPIWQRVLEEVGYTPVYVLTIRSPLESARSLYERNGIPDTVGLMLWMQYMAAAERDTRDYPRVVIKYSDLLSEPEACMREIQEVLEVGLNANPTTIEQVNEFLDARLRHHVDEGDNNTDELYGLPLNVYELLPESHEPAYQRRLDTLWQASNGVLRLLAPIISERDLKIVSLAESLDAARQHASELEAEIPKVEASLNVLASKMSSVEQALAREVTYRESLERSKLGRLFRALQTAIFRIQGNRVVALLVLCMIKASPARQRLREYMCVRNSGMFDSEFYLSNHVELQWMLTHPLIHYVSIGFKLGYDPNSDFDETAYQAKLLKSNSTPGLAHWLTHQDQ